MPATQRITLKPPKTIEQVKPLAKTKPAKETEGIDEDVMELLNGEEEHEVPLTKAGRPDRRFKGQRDISEEEAINPRYIKPRTGGTLKDGTHITINGKPDRRFKENRGKPQEQVMSEWAEQVYRQYAKPTHH